MQAFNYEEQRVVEGVEGTRLLLAQAREDLDLVCSERGQEYARFIGAEYAQLKQDLQIVVMCLTEECSNG